MEFYLLASPIGNLKDVTVHFLVTVSRLNYLATEDTRQTAKLLQLLQQKYHKYQLWPKQLLRSDRRTERQVCKQIISLLQINQPVGLVADAGMLAVADPGAYLVKAVRDAGFSLRILPGASALTAAMSLCGFDVDFTWFVGFWPKKAKTNLELIKRITTAGKKGSFNLIFFESPLRIEKTCRLLATHFPQAQFFLGRELTKKFQSLSWFQSNTINRQQFKTKGEYTAVVNLRMI